MGRRARCAPRRRPDGEELLLVGGESHKTGQGGDTVARYERLVAWADEHFGVRSVTHRFMTEDFVTPDSVPFAGPIHPGPTSVLVATGFNKWGFTNGVATAAVNAATVLDQPAPAWASAMSTNRLPLAGSETSPAPTSTSACHLTGGWLNTFVPRSRPTARTRPGRRRRTRPGGGVRRRRRRRVPRLRRLPPPRRHPDLERGRGDLGLPPPRLPIRARRHAAPRPGRVRPRVQVDPLLRKDPVMAFTAREIEASPAEVFAVLADPTTFPDWLIGASEIRDFDHNWPSPGTKFHHMVGVKPFVIADSTEVIDVEPNRRLKLRVRSRPLVVAEATFELVGNDDRCVVTLAEEPAFRPLTDVLRPLADPLIHVRNHRSLARLADVVSGPRRPGPGSAGVTRPPTADRRPPATLETGGEVPDLVGQPGGLVQRHEHRTVVDLDQPTLREEFGQLRPRGGAAWCGRPFGQMTSAGSVEGPQLLGGLDRHSQGVVAT